MSSTRSIDFRIRTNKAIERSIVFDAIQQLRQFLGDPLLYVGLGSVWFVDFKLAHRLLGIRDMISIEADQEIADRAKFNKPYRTIQLHQGETTEVIQSLLDDEVLTTKAWLVWLDYDAFLSEESVDELERLVRYLPEKSMLFTTFNARASNYADYDNRIQALNDLFGHDVVGDIPEESAKPENFPKELVRCLNEYLRSVAIQSGRRGGYVPAVSLRYVDSSPMATIGGILPAEDDETAVRSVVNDPHWIGFEHQQIAGAPLTPREFDALCSLLPSDHPLTGVDVSGLGFSLPEEQLRIFERHYTRFPNYAEIVA